MHLLTPEQFRAAGWKGIHMADVARLVAPDRPPGTRWRWEKRMKEGRAKLILVSPRGVRWDFRLQRGAWIKRRPPETAELPLEEPNQFEERPRPDTWTGREVGNNNQPERDKYHESGA